MSDEARPEMLLIYRAAFDVVLSARTDAAPVADSEIVIKREAYDSLVSAIKEVDRTSGFSRAF